MARLSSARIRRLVLIALAVMLVVPAAIVIGIEIIGGSERTSIDTGTRVAAHDASQTEDRAQLEAIARDRKVRLWLVDPTTRETLFDSDQQPRKRTDLGVPSLGMPDRPIERFEAGRVRPAEREHVVIAAANGWSAGCATYGDDHLLVCEAARRTESGKVVLAQRAAPRVTSRITDARMGLWLLAGTVLVGGAIVAGWLVRRLTRPLDALGGQVAARTRGERTSIEVAGAPREIAEIAAAVDRLTAELEIRNRKQAIAAADLAHELKSPLARIKVALDAGSLDAAARGALEANARAAVVAIDRIIADLLEIARAEAGLRDHARERTDLKTLAAEVLANRPPPPSLAIELTGSAAMAEVAAPAIARALEHLLDNAYAFAKSKVEVEIAAREGRAQITVRDDGPGVPADLVPKLFDRFASQRPGGTGLGLAYVRAVAEAHGGSARCDPAPSAAFVIELA